MYQIHLKFKNVGKKITVQKPVVAIDL